MDRIGHKFPRLSISQSATCALKDTEVGTLPNQVLKWLWGIPVKRTPPLTFLRYCQYSNMSRFFVFCYFFVGGRPDVRGAAKGNHPCLKCVVSPKWVVASALFYNMLCSGQTCFDVLHHCCMGLAAKSGIPAASELVKNDGLPPGFVNQKRKMVDWWSLDLNKGS